MNMAVLQDQLKSIDWNISLNIADDNIDKTCDNFLVIFNNLLDIHAPYKKISLKEKKLRDKPWITKGILTSTIKAKNRI